MKSDVSSAAILLVDDNQRGLTARRLILEEHGFHVTAVKGGEEAWEVFRQQRFDVVVTDYRLKGMTDGDLVGRIRKAGSPCRIAVLSGLVGVLGLTQDNTGADELISKSAKEVTDLLRVVRKLAHQAPRRRPATAETDSAQPRRKLIRRKATGGQA